MSLASRQVRSCASSAERESTSHVRKPLVQGSQILTLAIVAIDDFLDVMESMYTAKAAPYRHLGRLLFTTIPFTYTCFVRNGHKNVGFLLRMLHCASPIDT
jgi:hypothetical protein